MLVCDNKVAKSVLAVLWLIRPVASTLWTRVTPAAGPRVFSTQEAPIASGRPACAIRLSFPIWAIALQGMQFWIPIVIFLSTHITRDVYLIHPTHLLAMTSWHVKIKCCYFTIAEAFYNDTKFRAPQPLTQPSIHIGSPKDIWPQILLAVKGQSDFQCLLPSLSFAKTSHSVWTHPPNKLYSIDNPSPFAKAAIT
ncbi:hypothetical protein ACQKWADRAFT_298338 [Trichoderma austrokoningii]